MFEPSRNLVPGNPHTRKGRAMKPRLSAILLFSTLLLAAPISRAQPKCPVIGSADVTDFGADRTGEKDTSVAIQAAIGGQGVALSSTAMVADDLAAGRLVRPFGEQFKTQLETAYFLVYLPEVQHEPKIVAFRDWLLGEYGETECRSE